MALNTASIEGLTPGAHRILAVASQLFYERGIHSVGVDTIATEAEVTKPVLYKNFGSKDGLVTAYLTNRHHSWWPTLEQAIAQAHPPKALAFFDVYLEDATTMTRGCAYLNAAAELSQDHPAYSVIHGHKRSVFERLRELIEDDHPHIRSSWHTANHLFILLEGAFAHHSVYGTELLTQSRDIAETTLQDYKSLTT